METRKTNITLPDRQPYITVDLGEERGMHWLCAPPGVWVARLVQSAKFTTAGILDYVYPDSDGAEQEDSTQKYVEMLKDMGPEMGGMMGALIGRSWHHESLQLSTARPERKGDWIEYGEEVYDELHEAGYTLSELGLMTVAIITQIVESNRITKEVSQKAAFFFQTMVPTPSDASSVGSSTAGGKLTD